MHDAYLVTYLNDHLGASVACIELVRRCLANNRGSELGKFLNHLLLVLQEEQAWIRKLLRRLNGAESTVKKLGGWMLEKAGRLKLNNSLFRYSDLARVIELEMLVAGLQVQSSMWRVLEEYRSGDTRFEGIDFALARKQADEMLERMKKYHSRAAEYAFAGGN